MIVIDTNIIISALIKDSATRKIIVESALQFAYPEPSLQEIIKYKSYILEKSGYSKSTFDSILNKLLEYINLIPLSIIGPKLNRAKKEMESIDVKDAIFLALALVLDNAAIWSDDTDFEKQKSVRVLKTRDMVKMFEK